MRPLYRSEVPRVTHSWIELMRLMMWAEDLPKLPRLFSISSNKCILITYFIMHSSSKLFNLSSFPSSGLQMKMQQQNIRAMDLPSPEEVLEHPLLNIISLRSSSVSWTLIYPKTGKEKRDCLPRSNSFLITVSTLGIRAFWINYMPARMQ